MEDLIRIKAVDSSITGPASPFGTHVVGGELQLTGHSIAARVVLREPSDNSEHLIRDRKIGGKYVVRFPLVCLHLMAARSYCSEPTGNHESALREGQTHRRLPPPYRIRQLDHNTPTVGYHHPCAGLE